MGEQTKEVDIPEISLLVAKTFWDNPAYRQIFRSKDDGLFIKQFQFFFQKNFEGLQLADPSCICAYECDVEGVNKVACTLVLTRSDRLPTFWQFVWVGLLWLIYEAGWDTMQRLLAAGTHYDKLEEDCMHDRLHYTLHRMVVDPQVQGKGIGSRFLKQMLEKKADKEDLPVFLTTQKEINVRFYEKL